MEISQGKGDGPPTTLYICVNCRTPADMPSCAGRGAIENADTLEREIKERGIAVKMQRIVCFGQCPKGPNMRLAPGGTFFFGVGQGDLPAVLDHLESACGIGDLPGEEDDFTLPPPGT